MTAQGTRPSHGRALLAVMGVGSPHPTAAGTPRGKGPNAEMKADQTVFHSLLEIHKALRGTAPASDTEPFARLDLQ